MLKATVVAAESARYRADLAFVPGLWTPPRVWAPLASALANRGWNGEILHLAGLPAGLGERAALVAARLAAGGRPLVVVAHDAGAPVALAAIRRLPLAVAAVLVAPLVPAPDILRHLVRRREVVVARLRRGMIAPPAGSVARRCYGEVPPGTLQALVPEPVGPVREVLRGRFTLERPGVPVVVAAAANDPLIGDSSGLAARLGADLLRLPGGGHWPQAAGQAQATAAALHRWLVRRLGEALLDLHAEAMAARDAEDPDA